MRYYDQCTLIYTILDYQDVIFFKARLFKILRTIKIVRIKNR